MKILIIEDEPRLAEALTQIVKEQKYFVDAVDNGEDGLAYALSGQYDIILLDVMLPKRDGFSILRELRKQKNITPVLMLTARDDITDKITGLDSGADDYMTKPFAPEELLARIRAVSRRLGDIALEELSFSDLTLNLSTHDLIKDTRSIRLGFKEFEVLKILMSNPKAVVTKDFLITKIWGVDSNAEDNNVEAYISFLRKKLFFLHSSVEIATLRKVGYRLEAKESC